MKRVLEQVVGTFVTRRILLRRRVRAFLWRMSGPARQRRHVMQSPQLAAAFTARDQRSFHEAAGRSRISKLTQSYSDALKVQASGVIHLQRHCLCCDEPTRMLVDWQSSWRLDGAPILNWRERLVCSHCGMNNRQRLVARLVQQWASQSARPSIYLMEQVTPIFRWLRDFACAEVHGSEYLGHQYRGGERVNGVRHEDIAHLSFPDASFDMIVSNDVLEHVPDPRAALRECFRVLRGGGALLATFPFHVDREKTVARARLVGERIEHLLPAQYHGNPISSGECLVFHDFGWDLLDLMRSVGFCDVACEVYFSDEFGHLGSGLLAFRLLKPRSGRAASQAPE